MSPDIPDRLVDLKRAFLVAEARCAEIAASLPRAADIVASEAVLSNADRRRWDETWKEMQRIALALHLDPWWAEVANPFQARMALHARAEAPAEV